MSEKNGAKGRSASFSWTRRSGQRQVSNASTLPYILQRNPNPSLTHQPRLTAVLSARAGVKWLAFLALPPSPLVTRIRGIRPAAFLCVKLSVKCLAEEVTVPDDLDPCRVFANIDTDLLTASFSLPLLNSPPHKTRLLPVSFLHEPDPS